MDGTVDAEDTKVLQLRGAASLSIELERRVEAEEVAIDVQTDFGRQSAAEVVDAGG